MPGPQIPWVGTFLYFYVRLKQRPVMNLAEEFRMGLLIVDSLGVINVLTDLDKQNFLA